MLVVARFDPDVSAALLINTSLTVVLQAVVLQLFPILAYFGGLIGIYVGAYRLADKPRREAIVFRSLVLIGGGLALMAPLVFTQFLDGLPLTGVVGIVIPLVSFIYGWTRRSIVDFESMFALPLVLMALASIITALVAGMWLAPETAKVNGGTETVLYTLASDGSDVVVFSPGDHAVLRFPASAVADRQYCRSQPELPTLADKVFRQPTIPICPRPRRLVEG
ncbi:hypothetical protein [Kribbella sp. VKM Ac-2566]|uniref:hypothetical protein n=1 Tax=Kribbella sp. VKM Ac-2566 TaxID=2512218 RepID=UPI0010631DC7|nr:hypothetical protein [Kribbella sp. VKM Ac-2566]